MIGTNESIGFLMSENKPQGVYEFPLTEETARNIVRDLANNHTNRIRWSRHIKDRMSERGISSRQIMTLLKNKHSVFREGPYEEPNGDWKFNLKGLAAGNVIELTVALKNHYDDPKAALITVWFD